MLKTQKHLKEKSMCNVDLKKSMKGITLIALVITIIVLLILAGVTIATLTGENGILTRAQDAKNKTEQAQKNEEDILSSYEDKINEYAGIDWDTVLANAEKHPDQVTSTAIGVGTDGKTVNMDLWKYTLLDDGTYALNSKETLTAVQEENWSGATTGYLGTVTENGEIVGVLPQYIKEETDDSFIPVTDLTFLFARNKNIIVMPKIPDTVTNMNNTFLGCSNLVQVTSIPNSVTNMDSTFSYCSSLIIAPKLSDSLVNMKQTFNRCTALKRLSDTRIPNNVSNMADTFAECSALEVAPELSENVETLSNTFLNCVSLTTPPSVIPNSVTNMMQTFLSCKKLQGSIEINANLTGKIVPNGNNTYLDYTDCFKSAGIDGTGLTILKTSTLSSDILNLLVAQSTKIKLEN